MKRFLKAKKIFSVLLGLTLLMSLTMVTSVAGSPALELPDLDSGSILTLTPGLNNDGKLKISGTTDEKVENIAICIYEDEEEEAMNGITFISTIYDDSVTRTYSTSFADLNVDPENHEYTIKVADANGGTYKVVTYKAPIDPDDDQDDTDNTNSDKDADNKDA